MFKGYVCVRVAENRMLVYGRRGWNVPRCVVVRCSRLRRRRGNLLCLLLDLLALSLRMFYLLCRVLSR